MSAPAAQTAPVPSGPAGAWNLKFQDEFDGSALNTAKWSTGWLAAGITKGVNDAEKVCHNPANVGVSDGTLKLTLKQQQETCNGKTQPYSASLVNSNGKYQYTYGYAEARIYMPAAANGTVANWPAWWTNGTNWPYDGEDDIAEGLGGGMDYRYHYQGPTGHAEQGTNVPGNWTGWHTFGSEWTPNKTSYFYDGKLVGSVAVGTASPHYLILNNTLGDWGGNALLPATVQVDYVRVWQR